MKSLSVTYESSYNEPVHPDITVIRRLQEVAIGDCSFGCKIYADPKSSLKVLAHSAIYGCRR